MGMTIHYSGHARDEASIDRIFDIAERFAVEHHWDCLRRDVPDGEIERYDSDSEAFVTVRGRLRSIIMSPHPESESVSFEFCGSLFTQASTKTQFAPFEVHIEVVRLLREVEPHMQGFEVIDETGYWERGDAAEARRRFSSLGALIERVGDELGADGFDVQRGPRGQSE